jgi:hypothetical protein
VRRYHAPAHDAAERATKPLWMLCVTRVCSNRGLRRLAVFPMS